VNDSGRLYNGSHVESVYAPGPEFSSKFWSRPALCEVTDPKRRECSFSQHITAYKLLSILCWFSALGWTVQTNVED
jgi:hypothetical protein